jgi:hypothetical protein
MNRIAQVWGKRGGGGTTTKFWKRWNVPLGDKSWLRKSGNCTGTNCAGSSYMFYKNLLLDDLQSLSSSKHTRPLYSSPSESNPIPPTTYLRTYPTYTSHHEIPHPHHLPHRPGSQPRNRQPATMRPRRPGTRLPGIRVFPDRYVTVTLRRRPFPPHKRAKKNGGLVSRRERENNRTKLFLFHTQMRNVYVPARRSVLPSRMM